MKLKTNKLLTLTLATGLVAMTAGCGGGSNTPAATDSGGNGNGNGTGPTVTDTVAYSDWISGATQVTATTANGFVAGNAASIALTPALTGVESLNLTSEVAPAVTADTSTGRKALNRETLNGAAVDGVAFASNGANTELRYFAALHSGTDLGAPVSTATATATWENGLFQAVGADGTYATASKTFALTVTFGTTDTARTIVGLVAANNNANAYGTDGDTSYYISGTYSSAGVITGNVLYGDFATGNANDGAARTAAGLVLTDAIADDAEAADTVGLGTLSGLIGAQGAVGGFYSSGSDGTGVTGFAGGFVVSALPNLGGDDPDAVYADWSGSATLVTAITANGFVAGTLTGLDITALTNETTLDLADVYEAGDPATDGTPEAPAGTDGTEDRLLPGSPLDGVAFTSNGATAGLRYFAGLHNTTDLGAPIAVANDIEGTWNGLFQAVGETDYAVRKTFVLTVTFGTTDTARTITGLVPVAGDDTFTDAGDTSYYLSGTYDANGVITGSILYGDFATGNANDGAARTAAAGLLTTATAAGATGTATNGRGVLSGLIGKTEAIGAFYSDGTDGTGITGYAGGFVATKTAIAAAGVDTADAYIVDYAKWTAGATQLASYPTTTAAGNGFLGATTATALTGTPTGATTVSVDDTGVTGGALFFFNEVEAGTNSFFAGLHSDTNLGAPVPTSGQDATWTGPFAAVGATGTYETEEKDITLTIGFGSTAADRTIQGSVPDGAAADTAFVANAAAYHVNGVYDTAGVISGFIRYSSDATAAGGVAAAVSTATTGLGTLTGLIGASGAIGAFHSTGSDSTGATGYAGGFVVKPGS